MAFRDYIKKYINEETVVIDNVPYHNIKKKNGWYILPNFLKLTEKEVYEANARTKYRNYTAEVEDVGYVEFDINDQTNDSIKIKPKKGYNVEDVINDLLELYNSVGLDFMI